MTNIFKFIFLISLLYNSSLFANNPEFNSWLEIFKERAKQNGISDETINKTLHNAKFLPKVIQYDRYQPEFYEDTFTYIGKRVTKSKVKKGTNLFKKKKKLSLK